MRGLGRFYQLDVTCLGEADPLTGYFMNIKEIDQAVRQQALPCLEEQIADEAAAADIPMGSVMQNLLGLLDPALQHSVARLRLILSPYYSLEIRKMDQGHLILRQQYEFAAAHRLHVEQLSTEENIRIFGKCNNPSGHGHNYRIEVAVRTPINDRGQTMQAEDLDRIVDECVLQPLDHKHLNIDVPAFESLNSSVENIARVIWDMLAKPVTTIGVTLDELSVWETGKTVCTYRGAGATTPA